MISKSTDELKYKFIYSDKINVKKIIELPYFDNFENVAINNYGDVQPNRVKYIHFKATDTNIPSFVTHLKFDCNILHNINIPLSVTHLSLKQISDISNIPRSVTHLATENLRYQSTNYNLPSVTHYTYYGSGHAWLLEHLPSVTHLVSNRDFGAYRRLKMPETITHIYFDDEMIDPIPNDHIPSSVTHLRFGPFFNEPIDNLPKTVLQIELPERYNVKISEELIPKIIRR